MCVVVDHVGRLGPEKRSRIAPTSMVASFSLSLSLSLSLFPLPASPRSLYDSDAHDIESIQKIKKQRGNGETDRAV